MGTGEVILLIDRATTAIVKHSTLAFFEPGPMQIENAGAIVLLMVASCIDTCKAADACYVHVWKYSDA